MELKEVAVVIRRQPAGEPDSAAYESYTVQVTPGLTVLEALISIQENQDPTLSFRYSCRGAVCGACAMLINNEISLACRTQIGYLNSANIKIEPLPNLPVITDLVVDMTEFWNKYQHIKPWLEPKDDPPETERHMEEKLRVKLDPYANCILCASCYGVCPVPPRSATKNFLGPAALAKNYRFYADSREGGRFERLLRVDSQDGLWGCDTVFKCVDVCPKDVPPTHGIVESRKKLMAGKLLGMK
ncbi:succinate dehydrogenase/fumarate reductase iron-sulfur subunit [Dethiobacter alkaliphilus]|uniref:Fumarate reductase iron-sulfur subunit n=1 Tax=Dethiobacter alkaliphilus AHT 1 TaxID=555088 RepID=C0GDE3_DETAL|nr:succinate dehydrogenase/fumarate reductase iron-sulfur subunit [Dethiobacter alkaliphilus]EEG78664.1 succinate dehydrogenase and fumarate reductase iron-sulfur protein [Dethiobacter alkaliphilus AHT 1]MCW3489698.1 succinate dehydrogenase/fumarate reductase iron-sulfur subunit [Dethiobacter alkaliphilus]